MAQSKGSKQRNFPSLSLQQALEIPAAIQDKASGMEVSKLRLAEMVGRTPSSSAFREMLMASRAYGLTEGGVNGDRFELTSLGNQITSADELAVQDAARSAVLNIEPYRSFLTAFNAKKVPSSGVFRDWLVANARVPAERAQECMDHLLDDARYVGYIRTLKGSEYVELDALQTASADDGESLRNGYIDPLTDGASSSFLKFEAADVRDTSEEKATPATTRTHPARAKKVFIAHGKNRGPLEEIKKILGQFRVPIAVAIDEPHAGRPISAKVAQMMSEDCSSAIFIFTADERFLREGPDGEMIEVWRPSENAVYELGAASVLYDKRIVILKEKKVTFPSDFSDLGYLEFEADQIQSQTANLFSELVSLDIIEVRAKG